MIGNLLYNTATLRNSPQWLLDSFGSSPTSSGIRVNESTAYTYSAVTSAIRLLSEAVGLLPAITYERTERGKDRRADLNIYKLLHDQPNEFMTAMTVYDTGMGHLNTWGNAYLEIEWTPRRDDVVALWTRTPDTVQPEIDDDGNLRYRIQMPQMGHRFVQPEDMVHVHGHSFDGLVGMSPIRKARNAIGLGLAAEGFGASLFGNGALPSGLLKTDKNLGQEEADELRRIWNDRHQGVNNAQRTAILKGGLTWEAIGIPPEDAQFLETRKFQVTEIARFFRVPPHMIFDMERATFSNIEHQGIDFVTYSLASWLKRWEGELNRKVVQPIGNELGIDLFVEFLVDALLRGDSKTRYEQYAKAITTGWMTRNEAREKENMNPLDGLDEPLVPTNNMTPVGAEPDSQGPDAELVESAKMVVTDAKHRVMNKEAARVKAAVTRYIDKDNVPAFIAWADSFYDSFDGDIRKTMGHSQRHLCKLTGTEQVDNPRHYCEQSHAEIMDVIKNNDPGNIGPAILERLEQWKTTERMI